jgi:hypothetical protein
MLSSAGRNNVGLIWFWLVFGWFLVGFGLVWLALLRNCHLLDPANRHHIGCGRSGIHVFPCRVVAARERRNTAVAWKIDGRQSITPPQKITHTYQVYM